MQNLDFRVVNKIEKRIIIDSLSTIAPKILRILEKKKFNYFISFYESGVKVKFPLIFLLQNHFLKIIDKLEPKANIISAGVYFGFIKKNNFLLSVEGAEFLQNLNSFPERNLVIVNNNGEKAILYGNKIIKKMIVQLSNEVKKNDFLLIFNEKNELISIALSQVGFKEYQNLNHNEIIALNLIDKGYYLRRKQ